MARIRSIKPEFWTSEQVVDCSPIARLLFIGMLNFADDRGVLKNRPRTIKSQVFPEDDTIGSTVVRQLLDELVNNGLVGMFVSQDVEYIHILAFTKHQRIDRPTYKYPPPPKSPAGYAQWSATDRRLSADLFDEPSTPEGKGREGNGEDISVKNDLFYEPSSITPGEPALPVEDCSADEDPEAAFEAWWPLYPRRVAKGAARKAHASAIRNRKATAEQLATAAEAYARTVEGKDPEFIPHPASWLNAERYLEFLDSPGEAAASAEGDVVLKTKILCYFGAPTDTGQGETWEPSRYRLKPRSRWHWPHDAYPPTDPEFAHKALACSIADALNVPEADFPRSSR